MKRPRPNHIGSAFVAFVLFGLPVGAALGVGYFVGYQHGKTEANSDWTKIVWSAIGDGSLDVQYFEGGEGE